MAIKNNIDVFYFACLIPVNVFFVEDGEMDKREFLNTWKDIPSQNEVQFTLNNVGLNAGKLSLSMCLKKQKRGFKVCQLSYENIFILFLLFLDSIVNKMKQNNVFTIAKRNVEGQDMLYQSLKLVNQIWVLNELKMQPGNPNVTVSVVTVYRFTS